MTSSSESQRPHIYVDTNIILDAIESRWPPSAALLERIQGESWLCSTSRFTVLELLEAKQEERFVQNLLSDGFTLSQIIRRLSSRRTGKFSLSSRQLDTIYTELNEALVGRFSFITFQQPLTSLWDTAEVLGTNTSIAPSDAIHLATALGADCDILVSRDNDFRKIADPYIFTAAPERTERVLKEIKRI